MTRFTLFLIAAIMLLGPDATMTQPVYSSHDGYAVIIFKYNKSINIWGRRAPGAELEYILGGSLYRSFPTGPKMVFGDERIPEGIYEGRIAEDGSVSIVFKTYPDLPEFNEVYRITGPTLDRNVIPLRDGFDKDVREMAAMMRESGHNTIPIVILPGTLEPEVAEMLEKATNVREGQTLDDIKASVTRWKPVEEHIINTGRIPKLKFEGDKIIIVETPTNTPAAIASK